ncbi:6-hydroxymethylpterin diphosphokinase MptE-like protein, partial [Campylobacter sp. TTU_617]|uniref:6-hydroxymethylpterin diphosphokinase MptE-like protein n=1 Tax=Campylobacter sp. TTU_617 TaxID=2768148 RepID=UPI001907A685
QNKATIFCADSAYAILAKHNIKPDYVCMLERTDFTAEFFKDRYEGIDERALFILASLVHPKALSYLDQNKRSYMLVSKPSRMCLDFKLHLFGYLGGGPSVAYMNYSLAMLLKHKNIILIGQDLAYDENGNSHPNDYKHGSNFESEEEYIEIMAYGGSGKVATHSIWVYFKSFLEQIIYKNTFSITYNCTEGGARIEGSLEKPFKEVCEELLIKDLDKPFKRLNALNKNKQDELLLKA